MRDLLAAFGYQGMAATADVGGGRGQLRKTDDGLERFMGRLMIASRDDPGAVSYISSFFKEGNL
jgi:hypothetical protein